MSALSVGYPQFVYSRGIPETPVQNLNFKWLNQRQLRKNKRRKHAAGFKKAFS